MKTSELTVTASRLLHNSSRYSACLAKPGLVVQSAAEAGKGKLLPITHAQFADYVEALETSIDGAEADAICKALLN
jgi:hypothetical protein